MRVKRQKLKENFDFHVSATTLSTPFERNECQVSKKSKNASILQFAMSNGGRCKRVYELYVVESTFASVCVPLANEKHAGHKLQQ